MVDKGREPLVSIIIPVYNAEKYIGKCLDSAINQTYQNIEIIVVNDGSTDASADICNTYANRDKRIKIIQKANGGLVSARKAGIQTATGMFVAYLDDDDWVEADMYEKMVCEIIQKEADIVTSGLYRDYQNSSVPECDNLPEGVYGLDEVRNMVIPTLMYTGEFYKAGINIHIWNKLFRRELALYCQMKVDDVIRGGEDAAMVYPCIMAAEKVVITHKKFYHYCIRQNSDSICATGYQKELAGHRAIYHVISNAIAKYGNQKEQLQIQLNYLMIYLLLAKEPQLLIKEKEGSVFPFAGVKVHDKVILYGGGSFGCSLHRLLNEEHLCEVVLWVDKAENSEKGIVNLSDLKNRCDLQYEKIIISVIDGKVADEIYEELLENGIEKEKIVRVEWGTIGKDFIGEILG